MTALLARAELFVLAAAAGVLLSSVVCARAAPYVLTHIRDWQAARRHTALLAVAIAPITGAVLLVVGAVAPSLLSLFDPDFDHCGVHGGHAHLCFVHQPSHPVHPTLWVVLAAVCTWLAFHAVIRVIALRRAASHLAQLSRTGNRELLSGAIVLDGDLPFCASAGLLAPRVLVSRTLLEGLSPAQRQVVLAHEASHVRRRDALLGLGVRVVALLYPECLRQRLASELDLAAEQACDEHAAVAVGDRLTVAETILRVERAVTNSHGRAELLSAVGMLHSNVPARVEALLAEPSERGSLRVLPLALCAFVVALGACSSSLHHVAESSLSVLLH